MSAFLPSLPLLQYNERQLSHSPATSKVKTFKPCALAASQSSSASHRPSSKTLLLKDAIRNNATHRIPSLLASGLSSVTGIRSKTSLWRDAVTACTSVKDHDATIAALQFGLNSPLATQLQVSYFMAPLRVLAKAARWRAIFTILDAMWTIGGRVCPDERLLVALANDAVNARFYRPALHFFAIMRNRGITMGPFAYSVLLKSHGRATNVVAVKQVLTEIEESDFQVDTILLNSAIDALIRCGDLATAERFLIGDEYRSILDVASFNTVLKKYAEQGLISDAYRIVEQMEQRGYQSNDVTRNTLVSACVRGGDFKKAWSLLKDITPLDKRDGPKSISSFVQTTSIADDEVRKSIRSPSSLVTSDRPKTMNGTNDEKAINIDKDNDTILTTTNNSRAIEKSFAEVKRDTANGVTSQNNSQNQMTIALTSLLVGLAENGQIADALSLLEDMTRREAPPSPITYAALLGACFRQQAVSEAIRIFQSIPKVENTDDSEDLLTRDVYQAYIGGLSRTGDIAHVTRAAKITITMLQKRKSIIDSSQAEQRSPPYASVDPHNLVLDGYVRCGDVNIAEKYVKMMDLYGVKPNVVSFTTLMKGYAAIGHYYKARKAFEEIARRKLRVDRVALNTFLSVCARGGDIELALKVLSRMERTGGAMSPSAYSYTPIIAVYLRRGQRANAWEIYRRMRKQGIPVNDTTTEHMCRHIMAVVSKAQKEVLSTAEIDNAARYAAEILRDAQQDGVSGRVLRRCRRKLLAVFRGTRGRKHLLILDSPEFRSASENIFEKHGWNEIDSGWRVI